MNIKFKNGPIDIGFINKSVQPVIKKPMVDAQTLKSAAAEISMVEMVQPKQTKVFKPIHPK